jgi:hypothetical protein
MPTTPERRELIARLVEDQWDTEQEFDQFFASVADPEELHLFAAHFNMDTGVGEIRKVVRHPLCDRGTLLLVYWRLSPGWFYSEEGSGIRSPAEAEQYDLFKEAERRYLAAALTETGLRFDPRSFRGGNLIADNEQYGGLPRVPPTMFGPSPGAVVAPLW